MKCEHCGAEVAPNEKFCRVCGAPLTNTSVPAKPTVEDKPKKPVRVEKKPEQPKPAPKVEDDDQPKKQRNPKKLILAATAIAAVIVIVVGAILLFGVDRSPLMKSDPDRPFVVVTTGVQADDETKVGVFAWASDGDESRGKTLSLYSSEGERLGWFGGVNNTWSYCTSVWNGTAAVIHDSVLNFANKDGYRGAALPQVYTAGVSANGAKVAYVSGYDGNTGDGGTLNVYDFKTGDTTNVDNNVTEINAISPNGNVICYTAYDAASDAYHLRMSKNAKKGERILDCERVFGVSNDGKLVYFLNAGKLYAMKDGVRTRLCEYSAGVTQFYNSDCTQLLYSCGDGCFIVTNGSEIEGLSNAKYMNGPVICGPARGSTIAEATILPLKSFYETVLDLGGELHYFDRKDGELRERNFGSYIDAAVSTDGKKLAYIDKPGGVYVTKKLGYDCKTSDTYPSTSAGQGFIALYADDSLEHIYCANGRGELWQLKGGKQNMVSADVTNICVGGDGVLYFVYDGVVLCRANGSERVSIGRREGITAIEPAPKGVVVKTGGNAYYYRDGGDEIALSR